jgi:hypothetical protein
MSKRFQADAALLLETGTDFRQVPEEKRLGVILGDDDCVVVSANNVTEGSGRSQYGGTAAVNFPRLAGFTLATGKDATGLARWVWTLVGTGERKTRIVTAYRPVKPSYSTLRDRRIEVGLLSGPNNVAISGKRVSLGLLVKDLCQILWSSYYSGSRRAMRSFYFVTLMSMSMREVLPLLLTPRNS